MLSSCQASVELINVAALDFVEVARVPHHDYVARLLWRALGVHAAFHRQAVALSGVALGACGNDVIPGVRAAARERLDVVAGQPVAAPEVVAVARAVLATVVVAGEEDRVRHVLAQAAGDLDVLDEPDHERIRVLGPLGTEAAIQVRLDDLGLFGDDEDYSPLDRHQGHGLIARVERQASCHAEILTYESAFQHVSILRPFRPSLVSWSASRFRRWLRLEAYGLALWCFEHCFEDGGGRSSEGIGCGESGLVGYGGDELSCLFFVQPFCVGADGDDGGGFDEGRYLLVEAGHAGGGRAGDAAEDPPARVAGAQDQAVGARAVHEAERHARVRWMSEGALALYEDEVGRGPGRLEHQPFGG